MRRVHLCLPSLAPLLTSPLTSLCRTEEHLRYRFDREVNFVHFLGRRIEGAVKKGIELAGRNFEFLGYSNQSLCQDLRLSIQLLRTVDRAGEDAARHLALIRDGYSPARITSSEQGFQWTATRWWEWRTNRVCLMRGWCMRVCRTSRGKCPGWLGR